MDRAASRSALALAVPALLLLGWWAATRSNPYGLIPQPGEVLMEFLDLTVGGFNDDAFTGMLGAHLLASAGRVYGGVFLAALPGVALGLWFGASEVAGAALAPSFWMCRRLHGSTSCRHC